MRYLLTGHTGFKGAWLTYALARQGHEVFGYSLPSESGSLFEVASIREHVSGEHLGDIRDVERVREYLLQVSPDIVIHMAAQPVVRESYREPRYTFETNVMGTLNIVEAVHQTPSVQAHIVVTTDKVYRNINQVHGYVESDALGGDDPYSASKAMADLLVQSWSKSFSGPVTAVARAGNVIGGGDYSKERLFPDIVSALTQGETIKLRYPNSVRPWQHVLDCLSGYSMLADAMVKTPDKFDQGSIWNFGPDSTSFVQVGEVAKLAAFLWGSDQVWHIESNPEFHEADLLALDASKSNETLGWANRLPFYNAVDWTIAWYRQVNSGSVTPAVAMASQLDAYLKIGFGTDLNSAGNGI
jgi:CDP-glucose 4,6-dehydratase